MVNIISTFDLILFPFGAASGVSCRQVKSNQERLCTALDLDGGMWPHWEEYKKRVAARVENRFYMDLGRAVIRAVEEAEMQDHADSVCAMAIAEEEEGEWDFAVEDILGENQAFGDAVFVLYWEYSER